MKCAHAKADVQCNAQAHKRRFNHFRDAAETVEADTDARTVLRAVAHGEKKQKPAEVEVEGQLSKRAQKRVCVSCSFLRYARTTKVAFVCARRKQNSLLLRQSARNRRS